MTVNVPLDEKSYERALNKLSEEEKRSAFQKHNELLTMVGKPISLSELAQIIKAGQVGGMKSALQKYEELHGKG